jgi:hypothetical protein
MSISSSQVLYILFDDWLYAEQGMVFGYEEFNRYHRKNVRSVKVCFIDRKVDEIHKFFRDIRIKDAISYQDCIEAFLISNSLWQTQRPIVFLDDLKTKAILTVYRNESFGSLKQIHMRAEGYLISEIERTLKSLSINPKKVFYISNNSEWLSSFIREELTTYKDIVHINNSMPVLDGLKSIKSSSLVRTFKRLLNNLFS